MAKKRRNGRQAEIETLSLALVQNGRAMEEGNRRKHWSKHDIKPIQPLKPRQEDMFQAWYNDKNICAYGSVGTGKTFVALYLAINEILEKRQQKIIIVRSAVPTREIGFVPGTLEEKVSLYERPYHDIMWELAGRFSTYQDMKDAGLIQFETTSFIRGVTWDNCIIIIDEAENMTYHEIDSVMGRAGENTRVIFIGDVKQTDLDGSRRNGSQGIEEAIKVYNNMEEFELVRFNKYDIVRGPLVKSWIIASEEV